jgi:hypothetical protein
VEVVDSLYCSTCYKTVATSRKKKERGLNHRCIVTIPTPKSPSRILKSAALSNANIPAMMDILNLMANVHAKRRLDAFTEKQGGLGR